MERSFKAVLNGKKFSKEIELPQDAESVSVGTEKSCSIRLNRELFFDDFELVFVRTQMGWILKCADPIYIATDGVMKQYSKQVGHGDSVVVKYSESNQPLFKIDIFFNFDDRIVRFNRFIDISTVSSISIGHGNCDIVINDTFVDGFVTLTRSGTNYILKEQHLKYGVNVNGKRVNGEINIGSTDFFSICGYAFYVSNNRLFTGRYPEMNIGSLQYIDNDDQLSHLEYPEFNRSTRIKYKIPEDEIEVLSPEPKPQKVRGKLWLSLIPAVLMLGLTIVLRGVMSNSSNITFVLYSACSMSVGIVMSVVSFIYEKKEYKKEEIERERKYREYIANKEQEIQSLRNYELAVRKATNTSVAENIHEAKVFSKKLFEKSFGDEDFLDVTIGDGSVEASCKLNCKKQEFADTEDIIASIPEQLAAKYKYIYNAPIVSHVKKSNVIGFVGTDEKLFETLKIFSLDIALRHFYDDVKLFYIFDPKDENNFKWLRWLKHTHNEHAPVRNFIYDDDSKKAVLELIYSEISYREQLCGGAEDCAYDSHYVVFIFDDSCIANHPISRYLENAGKFGFTFIFFKNFEECLPKGCSEIILLDSNENKGTIINSNDGTDKRPFDYVPVNTKSAERIALRLGAVSVQDVSLESQLTKSITMFKLLGILKAEDLNLSERWGNSQVYKSMAAPIGVKIKDEVVYLDISDKSTAHGPHGLVAGTTGSGKSEILQTYILSMASIFHPYDVGFVIIDFKGGGMSNQFGSLPHMVGTITNIDGREINRSLLSIKAERDKRLAIFAKYGVNHINDYIKLYKQGKVTEPLPHLIIIVDEFAELKAEFPEFMKELISAARVGRTLGMHLILATQKPSGVVDGQIWSNSKFKLCLKVQTKEDSQEVIKTPLAAEIIEPGRAYFQVGNNEIFELFQSAYSGAKVPSLDDYDARTFEIDSLNTWGKRSKIYSNKKNGNDEESLNQLQAIVNYISDYCSGHGIKQLPGICLPPLKEFVSVSELGTQTHVIADGINVAVGIYDAPQQQYQGNISVSLSSSNTYIIGSSQTGKTSLLQTMIYQMIRNYSPTDVNIYIIDCGNMALKVFENANHVGGVTTPVEEEKVTNLFKLLIRQINYRKTKFAQRDLGTFNAYIEAGYKDLPQIFLIIDNVSSFREYYPDFDSEILLLSREGQSVGINLIVTATQTNAIGFKALSNFGNRIAFSCNDSGEYSNLFDRCHIEPKDIPGRGLCIIDKVIYEFQAALCVEGEKEYERVENLKHFISGICEKFGDEKAFPIPFVPEIIKMSELLNERKDIYTQPYKIPIGINYETVEEEMLNLTEVGLFAISGREHSGRTNFVMHLLNAINTNIFGSLTQAYIIDSIEGQLHPATSFGFVQKYTVDITDTADIVETIFDELDNRQKLVNENRGNTIADVLKDKPLLLLIVNDNRFFSELSSEKELTDNFKAIINQYKKLKVCVIYSNIDNITISITAPDVLKALKTTPKFIVFEDIASIKVVDIPIKTQKQYPNPIKPGDGYLCMNGEVIKIKTIFNDKE